MIQFGVSQVGQYHIDAGSDICQDANIIVRVNDDVILAIAADGVGSQEHSDIASKVAVEKCAEYFKEWYGKEDMTVEVLLKRSFYFALLEVDAKFKDEGLEFNDCTMCAVVYMPDRVVCGQSGDSGAIGLKDDGSYVLLSEKQNDDEGHVFPLRLIDQWVFKSFEGRFSSILVATDGFYDFLFPSFMEKSPDYNKDDRLTQFDYELASKFMDIREICKDKKIDTDEAFGEYSLGLVNGIPRKGGVWDAIDDDLTVVTVVKDDIIPGACERFSKPIDRRTFKRNYLIDANTNMYPGKGMILSEKGVYQIAQTFALSGKNPDYVAKAIAGNRLCLRYPKSGLVPELDISELKATEDMPACCLGPIDIIEEEGFISIIAKTDTGMTPLSVFLPARKRTESELSPIMTGFLKAVRALRGTKYEPAVYDQDRTFTDIRGNVHIDSFFTPYLVAKETEADSRVRSVVDILLDIWVGYRKMDKGDEKKLKRVLPDEAEAEIKDIFGIETIPGYKKPEEVEEPVEVKESDNVPEGEVPKAEGDVKEEKEVSKEEPPKEGSDAEPKKEEAAEPAEEKKIQEGDGTALEQKDAEKEATKEEPPKEESAEEKVSRSKKIKISLSGLFRKKKGPKEEPKDAEKDAKGETEDPGKDIKDEPKEPEKSADKPEGSEKAAEEPKEGKTDADAPKEPDA